jgi:thiol-disulfide isomerase/thioredoxin
VAIGPDGQLYASDRGDDGESAHDELNVVEPDADLGWPATTGTGLAAWLPTIGVHGVAFGASALPDESGDGSDNDHDRFGSDGAPGKARTDDNGIGECVGSVNRGSSCTSNADCPPRPPGEFAYCEFRDDPAEYCPGGLPVYDDVCGDTTGAGIDEADESYQTSLFTAASGELRRAVLTGPGLDTLSVWRTFLNSTPINPTAPPPPITDCPTEWTGLLTGGDGWIYALATNGGGAGDGGLYRVTHRGDPGPREVSPPGSPFPLRLAKGPVPGELILRWEDLREDAKQPRASGGLPALPEREYTIWRGSLGVWTSHSPHVSGIAGSEINGGLRREGILTPPDDSEYFLISGRGDNLEGSLGRASNSTERTGYTVTDLCQDLGYYQSPGTLFTCGKDFTLLDEMGLSKSLYALRGQVVLFDLSAIWCPPCQSQANSMENLYQDFKDREVAMLTVQMDEDSQSTTYEGRPTPAECRNWADSLSRPGGSPLAPNHTFPCLVEPNGPPKVAWSSYNVSNSLPTNVILDTGLRVVYAAAGYSEATIRARLDALTGATDSCLH